MISSLLEMTDDEIRLSMCDQRAKLGGSHLLDVLPDLKVCPMFADHEV